MTTRTTLSPATLLRLEPRDRAGLEWLRNRARFWLTGLKRRRKYLPQGEPYSEAEAAAIRALVALEEAAGQLLDGEKQTYTNQCIFVRPAPTGRGQA